VNVNGAIETTSLRHLDDNIIQQSLWGIHAPGERPASPVSSAATASTMGTRGRPCHCWYSD